MSIAIFLGAGLQFIALLLVGWVLGNYLLERLFPSTARQAEWPERCLATVVGFAVFVFSLMLLHIVVGGTVFSTRAVVPTAGVAVVFLLARRVPPPRGIPWVRVGSFTLVLLAIYFVPAVIGGSSIRTGDGPWHLGWTEQLLGGERLPSGPAPDFSSNAYPWGFHAILATLVRLAPGTDPVVAHEAVQLLVVLSIPLGAAVLGRTVRRDAGWAAAAAVSLIGGFGWIAARGPAFITSPREAAFGADLVVASPNSVYQLFAPPIPRELGLILLAAAGWLLCTEGENRRSALAVGAATGLVGLVSVPLFVSALSWMTVAAVVLKRTFSWWARAAAGGLVVFGLWVVPVLVKYVTYGGFVDITPRLGVEWPLPVALASWGILLPLAIAGAVAASRRDRTLLAFGLATLLLLAAALARARFGWSFGGNATVLHQGRVWPPTHLIAGALAGVAVAAVVAGHRDTRRHLTVILLAALLALGMVSPVLATVGLTDTMRDRNEGFVYSQPDLGPTSFVRRAARLLGPDDTVRVVGNDDLAFYLFQFSGCRLTSYDDPRLPNNDLRIRYRDLERKWTAQMNGRGFDATHVVLPASASRVPGPNAMQGVFAGRTWILVRMDD
ncbi:MAG: hypothetical protein M3277_04980 [Actinomycetota bacterium]|nr:hypothetical protein [Actinomycetota bacterium]